jgi:hypothetical protein
MRGLKPPPPSVVACFLERNQSWCALLSVVRGRRSFHPTDEDLSVGTPLLPPHGRRPVRGDPAPSTPVLGVASTWLPWFRGTVTLVSLKGSSEQAMPAPSWAEAPPLFGGSMMYGLKPVPFKPTRNRDFVAELRRFCRMLAERQMNSLFGCRHSSITPIPGFPTAPRRPIA